MKNEKPSIVFFGSGPVAYKSLELLLDSFTIEAVVTKSTTKHDLPELDKDTPVLLASSKQELDELFTTNSFKSEAAILVDFGIIVSNKIINAFPMGIINSHFSILPELRGADPITFAILQGLDKTGVSLMLLVEAMDEGPILAIGEQKLTGNETGPELTDKLIHLSDTLLKGTVPAYMNQTIHQASGVIPKPISQEELCRLRDEAYTPTYTRKLTKADGAIDWKKPAASLEREIRAFAEWPKSRATIGEVELVILEAEVGSDFSDSPGDLEVEAKSLRIQANEGSLNIKSVKPAGKKSMPIEAFLAGYRDRIVS